MADDARFAETVYRHSGLKLNHIRPQDVNEMIDDLCKLAGVSNSAHLLPVLENRPTTDPLWQFILKRVTVGETYFFRNIAQYDILRSDILPELIARRREMGFLHLNIWSAGCSTGEEPYTLAIMLRELIPDIDSWTITIRGTDINNNALETAKKGIYRSNSFRRETPEYLQSRYFIERANSTYELIPEIRDMVRFSTLNLIADDYPSFTSGTMHQDIIICRNVTIYFDEETTQTVINRFHEGLTDHGWLIVGHSEPVATEYREFIARNLRNHIFYQKITRPIISVIQTNTMPQVRVEPKPVAKKPAKKPANTPKPMASASKPKSTAKPDPSVSPEITIDRVREAVNKEDWGTALEWLATLEKDFPMDSQVHYLRGLILMHSGELDKARQSLRRSLYCDPTFAMAHYTMGELHFQMKNHKEANRCWVLAQRAVAGLENDTLLPQGDDLTVEMFRDLLAMRMTTA